MDRILERKWNVDRMQDWKQEISVQVVDYVGTHKLVFGKQTKTRRTMKTIQSVRGEGCASHSSLIWESMPLTVPAIPPSKLEGCQFIDIKYVIRVSHSTTQNIMPGTSLVSSQLKFCHEN